LKQIISSEIHEVDEATLEYYIVLQPKHVEKIKYALVELSSKGIKVELRLSSLRPRVENTYCSHENLLVETFTKLCNLSNR
jgi:3-deoxy-D-manno-octulosonic-acid transferase